MDDISFRANGGEVSALIGENGAGKSTLLKILSGDIRQDAGAVLIDGGEKKFLSPNDAIKSSVSVIYQERQLVPLMTVMENIFLDDLPKNRFGLIKRTELRDKTKHLLAKFGLDISPDERVGRLSVAYQQMVEIMKAYRRDSMIIAFDEPTASLTDNEIAILFKLIRQLRDEGKVILYVSHRMAEIFQVSDKIVVLKDGRLVKTMITADTDENALITAMVGRDIGDTYANLLRNENVGEVLLEVKNLTTEYVKDVSFTLRKGEVLGFSGLVGAGRTEVVRAIFGIDRVISGDIIINGEKKEFKSSRDAIDFGIALCPEDRKEQGLVLFRSIKDNVTMPVLGRLRRGIFLDRQRERQLADEAVEKYSIKTPTVDKITVELSGGNQQKVILGRWTSSMINTKLLILDEPTKGIDVGTKAEVYQMVCDFARGGIGVIFISSELTEVMNLSDRIVVMRNGKITGEMRREEATEEGILALAMQE
ncbi:MAG: sugar ABC transporter ATP-binding protein [Oscillospiraceae bacterium]|nr:sugar ABC transporter ATP-binding protein [Oscillospiraceae bacterium]